MATLPTCKYRDRVTNIRRITRRCSKNCGKINVVHLIQIIAKFTELVDIMLFLFTIITIFVVVSLGSVVEGNVCDISSIGKVHPAKLQAV